MSRDESVVLWPRLGSYDEEWSKNVSIQPVYQPKRLEGSGDSNCFRLLFTEADQCSRQRTGCSHIRRAGYIIAGNALSVTWA